VDVRVTRAVWGDGTQDDRCQQGWILVDGEVIAHVDPHRLRKLTLSLPATATEESSRHIELIVEPRPKQKVPSGAEVGIFLDFPQACWEYLHSNLNESLASSDPIVSSLAVLNAKVGRQRLRRASMRDLHPLTRAMLDFRLEAERDLVSAAKA
jgi:hypothetical protein